MWLETDVSEALLPPFSGLTFVHHGDVSTALSLPGEVLDAQFEVSTAVNRSRGFVGLQPPNHTPTITRVLTLTTVMSRPKTLTC